MNLDPQRVYLGIAVFLVAFVLLRRRGDLSPAEARKLVSDGARLVDVRTPAEFAHGHIEGALNVPVGEITRRASDIGPLDGPVVLYCASGTRSAAAARLLRSKGFSNVKNLGAMSRW
jgi:phage shock protein E